MGLATNWLAAALLAAAILFYVFVYTIWLKRRTPQNIVIGGAAGAFPPMIGWAAVTGDVSACRPLAVPADLPVDAAAFLGAGALSQRRLRRAGVPMLPVVAGAARDQEADPALHAGPGAGGAGADPARRRRLALRRGGAGAQRRLHRPRRHVWRAADDRAATARRSACSGSRSSISSVLFAALPLDRLLGAGRMSVVTDDNRRPRDSDRHRRQREQEHRSCSSACWPWRRSSSRSPSCAWGGRAGCMRRRRPQRAALAWRWSPWSAACWASPMPRCRSTRCSARPPASAARRWWRRKASAR